MILAVYYGHVAVVAILLEQKVDVNHQSEEFGYTALMYAARAGNDKLVSMLIASGAQAHHRCSYSWRPYEYEAGYSALMLAADRNYREIVHMLLCAGADETEISKSYSEKGEVSYCLAEHFKSSKKLNKRSSKIYL